MDFDSTKYAVDKKTPRIWFVILNYSIRKSPGYCMVKAYMLYCCNYYN